MSKAKYLVSGGKYAGKKIIDLVKSIKRNKRAKKSRARFEKAHGYKLNQSVKKYQNVASSGSGDKSAIVPVRAQTGRGSSLEHEY